MDIILENVRSFCDQHRISLSPLTLLVGENSTGKTSFLAMLAQVLQSQFPSTRPSFNDPPFDLGTFDSIATYKGGRYGRAEHFSLGLVDNGGSNRREVLARYKNYRGQPQLVSVSAKGEPGTISIDLDPQTHRAKMTVSSPESATHSFEVDLKRVLPGDADQPAEFLLRAAFFEITQKDAKAERVGPLASTVIDLAKMLRGNRTPVLALAPVRTKPRRTYDQFSDDFDPEGDHVPVVLARIREDESDAQRLELEKALNEFGEVSGLFERLSVRHLGNRPTDPFQLLVAMGGPPANLLDVGYGVSQTLPIVVQSILAAKRAMLLLQQPEVHLHPRAQAALGSFFARLVGREKKEFVIETHSDYLIDRIRTEVARGTVKASDVVILFFEREYIETRVHKINLDDKGNVVDAPESYRRFFLEEEMTLFSRAKE
jgi:energy-coupling factor transporter ATP-binding protein EcfA2